MDDDAQIHDHTDNDTAAAAGPEKPQEDLPERLRVHSLARVLGTTSRRVLDALAELDGRTRSAHSSIGRVEAVRVRDVLAQADASAEPALESVQADAPAEPAVELVTEQIEVVDPVIEVAEVAEPVAQVAEPVAEVAEPLAEVAEVAVDPDEVPVIATDPDEVPVIATEPDEVPVIATERDEVPVIAIDPDEEPESRLMLETLPPEPEREPEHAPRADYLPLFVAPQPVRARPVDDGDDSAEEDDIEGDTDEPADDDQAERPANRRRRRGRRGRGRGRGGDTADGESDEDQDTEQADEAAEGAEDAGSDEEGADDEAPGTEGANRRRRRRRRRKSGTADDADAGSPDDPPNTVVHERAPREKVTPRGDSDEIQGISGSTRLEAKRQRRRDGRDAGRRRPPILSEAEFLARREAVERTMIVRDKVRTEPPHEGARYTQIAVLEDGVVVEHFVTSAASASLVGNIYLGIVQNVLPSMEAAFVDIGRGRNGVLYAGEVNWEAAGLGGANRKIEQALKPGDYVVVQVSKDPVGHKGARLTTQVSLAGRYLVYVPGASSTGISRKLPDTERQRLKEILREVVPADAGVIIRTASEGVKESDIRADVTRLQERWSQIEAIAVETKKKAAGAAIALYEEPDVLVKVIRDLFNEDFSGLIVSGDAAWDTINDYVNSVAPELVSKLTKYQAQANGGPDVFAVHRIDEQLTKAMDRKVWLPSGGTLVIDRTEAMTVVDVNTGKFTGAGGNLEQTVTKNNLEAAEEIVRQLRLRDIGGIVVIDFIDMVLESNRDLVLRRLTEALARDRTRHQVSEVTSLGLIQLTRKRLGTGLVEAFSTTCTHCGGRGILLHTDPVDSAPPAARKPEPSTSRRSKRARKGKVEETAPPVVKVPVHPAGEHPMFKAMAAANGKPDGEHDEAALDETGTALIGDEASEDAAETAEQVAQESAAEDLDAEDFDEDAEDEDVEDEDVDEDEDEDAEDEDVEDEIDLDDDESEDDLEDIDLVDADDEGADSDEDDDDDLEDTDEADDDLEDAEDEAEDAEAEPVVVEPEPVVVEPVGRPRRRRAAARPAGPPR